MHLEGSWVDFCFESEKRTLYGALRSTFRKVQKRGVSLNSLKFQLQVLYDLLYELSTCTCSRAFFLASSNKAFTASALLEEFQ